MSHFLKKSGLINHISLKVMQEYTLISAKQKIEINK